MAPAAEHSLPLDLSRYKTLTHGDGWKTIWQPGTRYALKAEMTVEGTPSMSRSERWTGKVTSNTMEVEFPATSTQN
jgi:hypothetical protein